MLYLWIRNRVNPQMSPAGEGGPADFKSSAAERKFSMEPIDVGILSILPPLIAIVLALITKEVISSLVIGIISGAAIYSRSIIGTLDTTLYIVGSKMGDPANANILLFLAILGALVVVVTKAGGSAAYGAWAGQRVKSRQAAQLVTSALGCVIFIDDYFNCLTVGTVMRPVTDRYRVSRAKLAYILDATAAPVCIIAPVSSWAASVASQMNQSGVDNVMGLFLSTIPFNLYALLTLVMIVVLALTKLDFGPMAKFEKNAIEKNDLFSNEDHGVSQDFESGIKSQGKVMDLIVPIVALIVFCVAAMLHVGGFTFGGGVSIADAFGNTDASLSLAMGGFLALVFTFLYFMIFRRKVLGFRQFMDCIGEGVKSMVPADIILVLAWSISGVCRDLLNTGPYVSGIIESSHFPLQLLPAIVFAVACFLSFSMGTAWGTFGILIPIVIDICKADPSLMVIALAATLAGSVFGDHCSPISDTTILSSTGAGVNHLDHVSTQIPYAATVAVCAFLGYLLAGFVRNAFIVLPVSIVILLAALFLLNFLTTKSTTKKA